MDSSTTFSLRVGMSGGLGGFFGGLVGKSAVWKFCSTSLSVVSNSVASWRASQMLNCFARRHINVLGIIHVQAEKQMHF